MGKCGLESRDGDWDMKWGEGCGQKVGDKDAKEIKRGWDLTGRGQDKGGDMDAGGECGEGKRIGSEDNG